MQRSPLSMLQQTQQAPKPDPLKHKRAETLNNFAMALQKLVDLHKKELKVNE